MFLHSYCLSRILFFYGRNYCDVVKLQQRNLCCWAILCQTVTQIRVFQDVNHSILWASYFWGFLFELAWSFSSAPFLFYGSIPMRFRFHSFSKLKLTIEKTTPSSNILRIGSTYRFVFQLATDFQSINDARNIACVKNIKSCLFLDVNFKII